MMGLSCSHGAYNGSCSSFMYWRIKIAKYAGLPPLRLMEGFYSPNIQDTYGWSPPPTFPDTSGYVGEIVESLPIRWNCLVPDPLHELLYHSDCNGSIAHENCSGIADSLQRVLDIIPDIPHNDIVRFYAKRFINGLRLAADMKEDLTFH